MLPGFCDRVKSELSQLLADPNLRVVPGPNPTGTAERGRPALSKRDTRESLFGGVLKKELESK